MYNWHSEHTNNNKTENNVNNEKCWTERANIKTQIMIKRLFLHIFCRLSHVFRLNRRDKFMFHVVEFIAWCSVNISFILIVESNFSVRDIIFLFRVARKYSV